MKIFGYNITRTKTKNLKRPVTKTKKAGKKDTSIPAGRVSVQDVPTTIDYSELKKSIKIVKPSFIFDTIPLIRKLYKVNEDLGSALFDAIQLTNTGHIVKFDQDIKPEYQDKMRKHLEKVSENWSVGVAGIDGLVNKFIAQIYISGALSYEAVPDLNLTRVNQVSLLNPETIRFGIGDWKTPYIPYQKISQLYDYKNQYIKLNPNTYKYFGLLSDEDAPYGVPPFLTALEAISTQRSMKKNIDHILKQLGLLGYLEVKLAKPDIQANESEEAYKARLKRILTEAKQNVSKGFMDGVVVGYEEDHDFSFNATTKNLNGVSELFNLNEIQVANGLKTSGSFLGIKTNTAETSISIVFTKMLSQLKNVHLILSRALSHIYMLELRLAGFDFKDSLKVEFKPSTITDDLKLWQSREIKQRVLHNLWVDRVISANAYAFGMGYEKPHKVIEPPAPDSNKENKKQKAKDDKNKSARRTRDKGKNQPKRKDQDIKPR